LLKSKNTNIKQSQQINKSELAEYKTVQEDIEKDTEIIKKNLSLDFCYEVWTSYSPLLITQYKKYTIIITTIHTSDRTYSGTLYLLDEHKNIIQKKVICNDELETLDEACFLNNTLFLFYNVIQNAFTKIKIIDIDEIIIKMVITKNEFL
jgi:hypothetical protein